jgi:DNA-binding GntR family transcriptional regulator
MKTRLTENMFGEGVSGKKEVLVKGLKEPAEDVRAYLKSDEKKVFYILCKRVVEGAPAYLEEFFIPPGMFPDIEEEDLCHMSFYELMQQGASRKIAKVIQTVEITGLQGDTAKILRTVEGTPGLLLHRLLVSGDGIPVAYTRLTGSGQKYKLQTELERIA